MRTAILLFPILASCAAVPAEEPPDPAALLRSLEDPDLFRRDEAACRLSILGLEIPATPDTERMREGINRALEERSPEFMLWRAYHVLRAGCLARNWKLVSDALATQEFRLIEIYEPHERTKFVRFLAQPAAYVNRAGDRHDLFFWVQSVRKDDAWIVREIYVGLNVKFEAPFKQLSMTDRYPKDCVLARFFELEELQTLALVFPTIEEMDITYGRIRRKGESASWAGFHLNAGFVMDKKAGGRSVYYTAKSAIDPPEEAGGKLNWIQHVRAPGAGPLQKQGVGFWGAGSPKPSED